MAALRSGQLASTQEPCLEREVEGEQSDEKMASSEAGNGAEAPIAQPILPIQLESLLPEAASNMRMVGHSALQGDMMVPPACSPQQAVPCDGASSDYALPAAPASQCVYPSLPRSAPPCSPPLVQNFDTTPPPPPLQDLSGCDPWHWGSSLPWVDSDCSQWMPYSQEPYAFQADATDWQALHEECPAPPSSPPGLRCSPPEALSENTALWRFPSRPQSTEVQMLIVMRYGVLNAYEVLADGWNPCSSSSQSRSSGSQSRSCPAEFRYRCSSEAPPSPSTPVSLPAAALASDAKDVATSGRGSSGAKSPADAASPARGGVGGARQVRARAGQHVRMVWRKVEKSTDELSPTTTCTSDVGEGARTPRQSLEELSPSSRRGRPRFGRAGPRALPESWDSGERGLWTAKWHDSQD